MVLTSTRQCAQQFIRINDVAATILATSVNNPAPTISGNGAAIATSNDAVLKK